MAEERPFLREARLPFTVFVDEQAEDVLEDARFLIERLFHEARVVGDLERTAALDGRRRRAGLRGQRERHDRRARDLDEELRGGPGANRDPLISFPPHSNAVRRGVALLDLNRLSRFEMVVFDET